MDETTPDGLLEERRLVARIQRRDERAAAQLVRATQDRVYGLLVRMLADREEALDLSQEVYVHVFAHLDTFRGDSRLSTWILRIAKNLCLNRLAYLGRRPTARLAPERMDALVERVGGGERPDTVLEQRETRALVARALQELEPEQRLIIALRDIEDHSYQEIASITDLPVGTVKSRLHRARLALAEIVERMEGDAGRRHSRGDR